MAQALARMQPREISNTPTAMARRVLVCMDEISRETGLEISPAQVSATLRMPIPSTESAVRELMDHRLIFMCQHTISGLMYSTYTVAMEGKDFIAQNDDPKTRSFVQSALSTARQRERPEPDEEPFPYFALR